MWKALRLCEEVQVGKVEFERDALSIVKTVNRRDENWEWGG